MPSVNFCFRIHQPYQFKEYCFGDIGKLHLYEDRAAMSVIMDRLAEECYLPANKILLEQIKKHNGKFRVAFSISGTALELFEQLRPDLVDSFRRLIDTGCVELTGETYYNSYSWLHSKAEFDRQVRAHEELLKRLFAFEPLVFRNTDMIHDNALAKHIAGMGYKGMITDGSASILKGRSPNQTYAAPDNGDFGLLLRNAALSEDIACFFGKAKANRYAFTAERFAERIFNDHRSDSCNINVFLDYETFGIHRAGHAAFEFLEELPAALLAKNEYSFKTPGEALEACYPRAVYDAPMTLSVQRTGSDASVQCQRIRENEVIRKLYKLEVLVHETGDERLLNTWGRLQSAEHYCFINGSKAPEVYSYQFTEQIHYTLEKYQQIVNILTDFEISLITSGVEKRKKRFAQHLSALLF